MNARMPGICATFGRRSAISWSTDSLRSLRGFSSTQMRPEFIVPPLLPIEPTMTLVLATFGSSASSSATRIWWRDMSS